MIKKTDIDSKKLREEIISLKQKLLNFNFQKSSGQLEKTSQIKIAKKEIARIKTKLSKLDGGTSA